MNPQASDLNFVHLRNHSDYSITHGSISYQQLVSFAASQEASSIALTDDNNLCASIKFYKSAIQHKVKPIFGIDCRITATSNGRPYTWTLLAMNQTGFMNLKKISTRCYSHSQKKNNIVLDKQFVFEHNEGLLVLSGGAEGEIGHQLIRGNLAVVKVEIEQWLKHFNNRFYIELQRIGKDYEEQYITDALVLAEMFNCPIVATNNSCFPTTEDFESHEVRVCIQKGVLITDTSRKIEHTREQYLKSSQQMIKLFADIPEAIINTLEIAKRCTVDIELYKTHLPTFDLSQGKTFDQELEELSSQGLQNKILKTEYLEDTRKLEYQNRLEKELSTIKATGFSAYFLIVNEFIQWSKDNDIPVGPGRGSAAGSLVAFSLGITSIDPLRYGLLFERFLNTERVSMPDMDIDFSVVGRDKVIEHVTEKYGQNSVSQIITFGTLGAKNVVRDTCRALGHPYLLGDSIAKLIPDSIGISLSESIKQTEEIKHLIETNPNVAEIIEMSLKLEGMVRHLGTHPAGIVIAPSDLLDYTPMYHDPISQMTVTQLDKHDIEDVGLVKFDFLGLKTLTIIEDATKSIQQSYKYPLDISTISLEDSRVYELLRQGNTDSVFQLESNGMRRSLRKLKLTHFEEIVALLALYRPGPMQFIDEFIDRKFGRLEVIYLHPVLKPILEETYGIAVYQEQVMRIAQDLAGYTLAGADILRRAMGKKDTVIMAQQKQKFINGAVKKGTSSKIAEEVFSFVEKFAEYGFNKSHSAAYAVLSYQTAWLKAHYPTDFYTAVMNNDRNSQDKIYQSYRNCKKLNIEFIGPHINLSDYSFTISDDNNIIYGLGAIKGIGAKSIELFCEERKLAPYRNLFDFCQRINRKYIDSRVLEALICTGCFDGLGSTRAEMHTSIHQALQLSEQTRRNWRRGTGDLFGGVDISDISKYNKKNKETLWTQEEMLERERRYLGFYMSGHPTNTWQQDLDAITTHKLESLSVNSEVKVNITKAVVAGVLIHKKRYLNDRRETNYYFSIDDGETVANFICNDKQKPNDKIFDQGKVLVIVLKVKQYTKYRNNNGNEINSSIIEVDQILSIEEARYQFAKGLRISLAGTAPVQSTIAKLRSTLAQHLSPHGKQVFIRLIKNGVSTELRLGEHWRLEPTSTFLEQFEQHCPNYEISPIF